ncbi:MAG: hypothetical protein LT080_03825 [Thiobacillus sp.]|jgi:hypothetical protein|nr:hypothetical protein [Thiobacillus sp.]
MLTVSLTDTLESAVIAAAHRAGMTVDDYVAAVCADALSLEIDRARLDSYLAGTPAVPHEAAQAWLSDLAAGRRTECPR